MRIDEKEDFLSELCSRYGLHFSYGWGYYYISFDVETLIFPREELRGMDISQIEFCILDFFIEVGFT